MILFRFWGDAPTAFHKKYYSLSRYSVLLPRFLRYNIFLYKILYTNRSYLKYHVCMCRSRNSNLIPFRAKNPRITRDFILRAYIYIYINNQGSLVGCWPLMFTRSQSIYRCGATSCIYTPATAPRPYASYVCARRCSVRDLIGNRSPPSKASNRGSRFSRHRTTFGAPPSSGSFPTPSIRENRFD